MKKIYKIALRSFLFIAMLGCVFSLQAQITVNSNKEKIRQVLSHIEQNSGYRFFFNNDLPQLDNLVTISMSGATLENVLDRLLQGTDITYIVEDGKQVILADKSMASTRSGSLQSATTQQSDDKFVVTGFVRDTDGQPVGGVTVIERGTANATITNPDGSYSIRISRNPKAELEFSSIGYKSNIYAVNSRTIINASLSEDVIQMETMVVIGYGSQRKEDLSMAVSTMKVDDALKSRAADIATVLQGRIPGMTVQQTGDPMRDATFTIRGRGNKGDDTDPNETSGVLVVVDGVPGAPYSIDDIETITVLKDAASAAIYGAQVGAGGVVMITTKQARSGKIKVDVNVSYGFSKVSNLPNVLTAEQYNTVWAKATENAPGTMLPAVADPSLYPWGAVTRTDWLKEIYRTGQKAHYAVTMSGGTETMQSIFSISYDKQEGVLRNTNSEAVKAKLSSDFVLTPWLKFSQRVNVSITDGQGNVDTGHQGPIIGALLYPRSATVYEMNEDGTYALDSKGQRYYGGTSPTWASISGYPNIYNPVAVLDKLHRKYPAKAFYSTSSLEAKPVKGLTLRTDFTADYYTAEADEFYPKMTAPGLQRSENYREEFFTTKKHWLSETTATYARVFGKHNVSAMAGITADWRKNDVKAVYTGQYPTEEEHGMTWGSAEEWDKTRPTQFITEYTLASMLGRIGYSYDDRYFILGSLRRDGSSKLPSGEQYDYFPAVSGSWKLSSEKFFQSLPISRYVNLMKFRAGWGKVGNVDSFDQTNITNIALSRYTFPSIFGSGLNNTVYGTYLSTIANQNAKWETTVQTSAGLDLTLFDRSLDITIDWYRKETRDLIDEVKISQQTGVTSNPMGNVGTVLNKGWEFSANYNKTFGEVSFSAWGNYNYNKGYVKEYATSGLTAHTDLGVLINSSPILYSGLGYPWRSFYVYRTAGIFQSEDEVAKYVYKDPQTGESKIIQPNAKPGDVRWVDTNNDGVINDKDKVMMGSYEPRHTFAFGATANWRGFDLSVMFQGVAGNYIYNGMKHIGMKGADGANMVTDVLGAWDFNPNSRYPRLPLQTDSNSNYSNFSDLFLEKGDYLRMKNLTLGYTVPKSLLQRAGLEDVRLRAYVSIDNVFTITGYSGMDPEVGNFGVDRGVYPMSRFFNFGVNINF